MGNVGNEHRWQVGEVNFLDEVRAPKMRKKVALTDETIREGEETPGVTMTMDEKIQIVATLAEMGVTEFAVGLPGYLRGHSELARELTGIHPDLCLTSLIRIRSRPDVSEDIKASADAGLRRVTINTVGSTPRLKSLGQTPDDVVAYAGQAIRQARELGLDVTWGIVDATRGDFDLLRRLMDTARENGADRILPYDTLALLNPTATRWWVEKLIDMSGLPFHYHCHNDFGLGVANSCAAVEAGAEFVDVCVNGLGDRAGNCSFEELAVALEALYGIDTGIDLTRLKEVSVLVEKISKVPVAFNKPVVGNGTFIIELNGKAKTVLQKLWQEFEPLHPEAVGQTQHIWFGSTTSMQSLRDKVEFMGLSLAPAVLDRIMDRIQADVKNKGFVSESEAEIIIRDAA